MRLANLLVANKPSRLSLPFLTLKDKVLGKKYELSLVFIDKKESKKLNKLYRKKDKPTNVLSFPISETSGEIFIDLDTAKVQAPEFGMNFKKFVKYLYIHGLLHLKGMDHGDTMEKAEKRLLNGASNRSRH